MAIHRKASRYGEAYKERVWQDLRTLFQQDHLTDIMLAAEGQSIPCHRVLLAAASQFFHEKFVTNLESLEHNLLDIEGIDFDTLTSVVSFIYSGDIELTPEKALKLCPASIKLMLPELTGLCEDFLLDQTNPDDPDVSCSININKMAKENSMEDLANRSWQVMLSEFPEVIETGAFKEMSEAELVQYIEDDGLNVANEDPVFEALVTWIRHDLENRKFRFESLLDHVTLSHCSLEFLRDTVRKEPLIVNIEGFYEHLAEAFCLHATMIPLQSGTPRKGYTGKYTTLNSLIAVCDDRCWVLQDEQPFWIRQRFSSTPTLGDSSICMAVDAIVVTGGRLYGKASKQCWKISLQTLQWDRLPDLNVARFFHSSVCVGRHIYVLGGLGRDRQTLKSVEYLDDKVGAWYKTCDMPLPLYGHTALNSNNNIYVLGGNKILYSDFSLNTFVFDVVNKTWSKKADMPQQCASGLSHLYRGKIYMHGGDKYFFMRYDPYKDGWETLSSPAAVEYSVRSVAWKDRILLHGGTAHTDGVIEEYNPDTDTWSAWEPRLPRQARCPNALFAVHLSKRLIQSLKWKLPGQTVLGDGDDVICSIHTLYDNV